MNVPTRWIEYRLRPEAAEGEGKLPDRNKNGSGLESSKKMGTKQEHQNEMPCQKMQTQQSCLSDHRILLGNHTTRTKKNGIIKCPTRMKYPTLIIMTRVDMQMSVGYGMR